MMTLCSCCGMVIGGYSSRNSTTATAIGKTHPVEVPPKFVARAVRYWRESVYNDLPPTMDEILKIEKGNDDGLA